MKARKLFAERAKAGVFSRKIKRGKNPLNKKPVRQTRANAIGGTAAWYYYVETKSTMLDEWAPICACRKFVYAEKIAHALHDASPSHYFRVIEIA